MSIKDRIQKACDKVSSLEAAYKDDKTTGEYQDAHKARLLLESVLRSIG